MKKLFALSEKEITFNPECKKDVKKIKTKLKEILDDSKYKMDVKILSDCIAQGINSNMDFEIITDASLISNELNRINNMVKKEYGPNYDKVLIPIWDTFGSTSAIQKQKIKSVC